MRGPRTTISYPGESIAAIIARPGHTTPKTPIFSDLLAAQARKYGLGLIFATQAPKGLHNRIPGNAATQFVGLLNAPVQIAAAREWHRPRAATCRTCRY